MPRILQYEGISKVSRTIRFLTWSDKSHTAWEHDDGRVTEAWHKPNGVRTIANFSEGHTPGTVVKAYTLPTAMEFQLRMAELYISGQVGKGYSFNGCLRFLSRRDPQHFDPQTFNVGEYNPEKWFCSCLIFAGLMHGGINLLANVPPWRASPGLIDLSPLLKLDETLTVAAPEPVPQAARRPHKRRIPGRTFRRSAINPLASSLQPQA